MTPVILPRSDHPVSRKNIDPDALKVLYRLKQAGHTAYLVGGGVRDLMLGRRPKDFDISTSANPNDVRRLFRNCRLIGRRFRLAHILFGGKKIVEVATFRRKSDEEPGGDAADLLVRRENTFGSPEEDAERRDYTINGLFYDIATFSVIDYVGGLKDLEEKTIRTIGDPEVRMREDPVRMLRAVKFAARLDFQIAPEDMEAIRQCREELLRAAPERLLLEWGRLLGGGSAEKSFRLMEETGVLETLVPEVARFIDGARAGGPQGEILWRDLAGLDLMVAERKASGRAELSQPVLLGAALTPVIMDALGVPNLRAASAAAAVIHRRGLGFAAGLELLTLDDPAHLPLDAELESASLSADGADDENEPLPGDAIGTAGSVDAPPEEVSPAPDDAERDDAGDADPDSDSAAAQATDEESELESPGERPAPAARRNRRQLPVFAGSDPASRVGELLAPFILRLAVPRRDTERLIQIVAAQKKMRSPGRRLASQRALARKQYFDDALDLFEVHVRGTGRGAAELRLWKSLGQGEGRAPADRGGSRDEGRNGSARRRGRRGRGGSGGGGARPEHAAGPSRGPRRERAEMPLAEVPPPRVEEYTEAEEAALRRKAEADQMLREAAFQHPRHLPSRAVGGPFHGGQHQAPAPGNSRGFAESGDSGANDRKRRRRRRRGGRSRTDGGGPPRPSEG